MDATATTKDRTDTRPDSRGSGALGSWLLVDLILVGLFALIGRAAHRESLDFAGWFATASPFLVALAVGWAIALLLGVDTKRVSFADHTIIAMTIALGLGLRVLSGETAEVPFVLVATVVLLVFLLVPRLVVRTVARRR
nr:DUF3054 domain-containing protein [Pseudoclavibacter sp. Marseille-Q3772]